MKLKSLKPQTRQSFITYALLLIMFIILQLAISFNVISYTMMDLLVQICIYSIAAVALNLTVGILGELSLGQAGFMCLGAYAGSLFSVCTSNIITVSWLRFPIALIIGGLFAALFGILIGIPVLRLKGDYLAIVTLAFGEIIKNVLAAVYLGYDSKGLHVSLQSAGDLNLEPDGQILINGSLGITGTPQDSSYIVGFVLLFITLIIAYNFVNSRTGRAVMAIRDNRIAAESVGINITKYKLITFALTAFLAGVAGTMYSHSFSILKASKFDYNLSIVILVYVVLGGMGSIRGSVIATIVLYGLSEGLLRVWGLGNYRMLMYAIILIVMMILTSNPTSKAFIKKYTDKFKALMDKLLKKNKKNTANGEVE